MDVDVKAFLCALPTKSDKLGAWEAPIFELLAAGAGYAQVVRFLALNGIRADRAEVYRFAHRRKRKHLLVAPSGATGNPPEAAGRSANGLDKAVEDGSPAPPKPRELPRFDWQSEQASKDIDW